ncbi:MAG: class I SAM-dependent RNA methyltransferase [Treponema sp.]|nr:class I SAM-dependent RNA methyltransferase [Treponema sp.]MBR0486747.1 class I SAM-dependent RNA methyltransferase [Treponema sp.]MBR4450087.1 class I SAM-dependent RNA methyltransferase [Treponema sp.]
MNTLVALCAVGAEKVLGNEIKFLGYKLVSNAPGRVIFTGDDDALFRANLCLRTADRVYLLMARYKAQDFDQLFDGVYSVEWQDFLKKDSRVVVDKVRSYKSVLNSEHSIQGMVQKAIYKKLGDKWHIQTLPETGDKCDVRVYLDENEALILLDLSGVPLYKRGYRSDGGVAPLRETTAAVLLQLMLWRRKIPLHDPFCGSGTLPIEATLYALNIAPGLGRRFAIENLPFFSKENADRIRKEEAAKIRTDVEVNITGTDIDRGAVERARQNAEHAGVMAGRALKSIGIDSHVWRPDFQVADFKEIEAPFESGMIICNPPYGERLGDEEQAALLYKEMGSLFTDFKGWQIGVITAHKEFQENIGRYATSLKSLKAGNLDTTFYMYDGTEKEKKFKTKKARVEY